jgi:hypothetical protein
METLPLRDPHFKKLHASRARRSTSDTTLEHEARSLADGFRDTLGPSASPVSTALEEIEALVLAVRAWRESLPSKGWKPRMPTGESPNLQVQPAKVTTRFPGEIQGTRPVGYRLHSERAMGAFLAGPTTSKSETPNLECPMGSRVSS